MLEPLVVAEKHKVMFLELQDQWAENDIWEKYTGKSRVVFSDLPEPIKVELKYTVFRLIKDEVWVNFWNGHYRMVQDIIDWASKSFREDATMLQDSCESRIESLLSFHSPTSPKYSKVLRGTLVRIYKFLDHSLTPEFDKDVWDVRNLGVSVSRSRSDYLLTFTPITQKWLLDAAKQFMRYSLSHCSPSTCLNKLSQLKNFSSFLDELYPEITPDRINRRVILNFLAHLKNMEYGPNTIIRHLGCLQEFMEKSFREGWANVPNERLVYREDYPPKSKPAPRFIPEFVLQQLSRCLEKFPPLIQRMVLTLQECGMRIGEVCTLSLDCLSRDREGDWFLKYYQPKLRKEHTIPVTQELVGAIIEQQEWVRDKFGDEVEFLFPIKRNRPVQQRWFLMTLNQLANENNIVDEHGNLYHFESHQFRHTVGTQMINNGVPLHIIQRFLGHLTPEMTTTYAHLHDETAKKAFMSFKGPTVDIRGKTIISDDPALDAGDVQWMKRNILAQSLPNGSCTLPVIAGPCPHANGCLMCDHFRTDGTYLDVHKEQLKETTKIIEVARQNHWSRQQETNETVARNLEHIIQALEAAKHDS